MRQTFHVSGKPKHRAPKQRFFANPVNISLATLGIVLLGFSGWLGYRAIQVKNELGASQKLVSEWMDAARANDYGKLIKVAAELQHHSSIALEASEDPSWKIAEYFPFVGSNLSAVSSTAATIDLISQEAVTPLSAFLSDGKLSKLVKEEGGLDIETIKSFTSIIETLSQTVEKASDEMESVSSNGLIPAVAAPVEKLKGYLVQARPIAGQANEIVKLLPAFLGADGERRYLVLFQNNAEVNSLGGDTMQHSIVTINNGSISLGETTNSLDIYHLDPPIPIAQSAVDIFGEIITRDFNLSTSRPDFPTTGVFAKTAYERETGQPIDGVIAMDPVFLGYLLEATGPIPLSTGDVLDSNNAAALMTHDIYLRYPDHAETATQTDAFFSSAVSEVFSNLSHFKGSPLDLIKALGKGVSDRRLLLWSANETEQEKIAQFTISGILPTDNSEKTVIGVYMRDFSAGKMDYFMRSGVTTQIVSCIGARISEVAITSKILNTVESVEWAKGLPQYVLAGYLPAGQFTTGVYTYGPIGATVKSSVVTKSGISTTQVDTKADLGRPVATYFATLAPGEEVEVSTIFSLDGSHTGPLEIQATPNLNPTKVENLSVGCDATPK